MMVQATGYPIIHYRDWEAAIAWLIDVFQFEALNIFRDDAGKLAHVELKLGDLILMPGPLQEGVAPERAADFKSAHFSLYVAIDEIDAYYEHVRSRGAEIAREIFDTDYGSRDFSARDLDGNFWHFGTYRP
jgi:uncharacterized glyoxalase superfamily protein PhnB